MIELDVAVDDAKLKEAKRMFELMGKTNELHKAFGAAAKRAATAAQVVAQREIPKSYFYNYDGEKIKSAFAVKPVPPGGAGLFIKGRRLALSEFFHKVTTDERRLQYVFSNVKKGNPGGTLTGAFKVVFPTGHAAIVERKSGARLPLAEKTTVSVPQMVNNETISEKVGKRAAEIFKKRVDHEIEWRLKGK